MTGQTQLELLYQVSRDLTRVQDEAELLQVLIRPVIGSGVTTAQLLYFDLDEQDRPLWAELVAAWQSTSPVGTRFYLPDFPVAHFWLSSPYQPVLIGDIQADERCDEIVRRFAIQLGIKAQVFIPLTQTQRWVGLLSFSWPVTYLFNAQEAEFYAALQSLAAPVVENRRLVARLSADINEREQAEQALKKSEALIRSIIQNVDLGILLQGPDAEILLCNKVALELLGLTEEQLLGKTSFDQDWEVIDEAGRSVPGPLHPVPQAIARRQAVRNVILGIRRSLINDRVWLMVSAVPEIDLSGTVKYVVCSFSNITPLKQTQEALRASEERFKAYATELERSNQELQDFAYVASHDLQEPLRKIRTFGDRLKSQYSVGLDSRAIDYLERMQQAAMRMQTLIQDLLTFSRVTTRAQPFNQVDLNRIVQEVISDLDARIYEVKGEIKVGPLPLLEADATQMRQLFQNLISNALKFHRPSRAPIIVIESQADQSDGYYQVTVIDNGIGFDEKYAERIFGVFQRLHGRREYEGTGVGLAVCRKIVERHGGSITAKGIPGQGAIFTIILPVRQAVTGQNEDDQSYLQGAKDQI